MSTTVLSKSFIDNNSNVNEDQAMEMIVRATQKIKELEDERSNDDKLNAAKQIAKDLNAGYTSAIKYERAKIAFLLEKLEEIQSGDVNPTSSAKG
jgi:hypothetical protein